MTKLRLIAEDEAYIADIPDFEMCSAHGSTPQEALEQVLIARSGIIEVDEDAWIETTEASFPSGNLPGSITLMAKAHPINTIISDAEIRQGQPLIAVAIGIEHVA